MIAYLLRRLLWAVATLWLVGTVAFVLFYLLPTGDPAYLRGGNNAAPETIAEIRRTLGLDEPLIVQYWTFLRQAATFDFGYSWFSNAPVGELIADRLPATISLTVGAIVLGVAGALPAGIAAARWRGRAVDRAVTAGALLAISTPVYWLGLVALVVFADDIGVVPLLPGAGSYRPLTADPVGWFGALILPWLVLAAGSAALYTRILRSRLVEALEADHVRTARAKGLTERQIVVRHGLRVAAAPVITLIGIDIGLLLGGVVLVESVFNIPGIGRLGYDAIVHADFPVIQGTVLFAAAMVIAANLAVDVVYAFLDPRVRYR